jgi:hypothetical protein
VSWTTLDQFTFTRGILQHIIMDVYLKSSARFRIVQTAGSRVNIDDITLYKLIDDPTLGDVNGDGEVNIADVNYVIRAILSDQADENCDVNGDDEVNIADVNFIIKIILAS